MLVMSRSVWVPTLVQKAILAYLSGSVMQQMGS